MTAAVSTEPIAPDILAAFAPAPELTVSEWADAHRMLPETSAEPGRWRTARAPYLRGIQDAVTDPAIEFVVVMASAQVGKTESLLNVLGYFIAHDPGPTLVVHPTIDMAETFSKDRLAPMIRDTPALRAVVREGRVKGATSTVKQKVFPGGYIALAGANSPVSLAQRPTRLMVADDVDRFPPLLTEEGDPLELAIKRTTTFANRKVMIVSTPTVQGSSRIETWFQQGDQRRYHVPCPACGHRDYLTWNDERHFWVRFEAHDPATAHLVCPACAAVIDDSERPAMLAAGAWVATAEAPEPATASFHVWEAYSPWRTLAEIAQAFLGATRRGALALRVWVNTTRGETWDEPGTRVESHVLLERREPFPHAREGYVGDLPPRVCCLTAAVDTQDEWLELAVWGFAPGEESWLVDTVEIRGDPQRPEPWAELDRRLATPYRHAAGVQLHVLAACIDSAGHRTQHVYAYCARPESIARRVYCIIGRSGPRPFVGPKSPGRYGRVEREVDLYTVGTDEGHSLVSSRLLQAAPGPGYIHLPIGHHRIGEEYVAQLAGMKLVARHRKGRPAERIWEATRPRVEARDCAVYALAALRLLSPNLEAYAARIAEAAEARDAAVLAAAAGTGPAPRMAPPLERRISRSSYLTR